jgi:hypothetical protein
VGRLDGLLSGAGGEGERDISTPDRTEGGVPSSSSPAGGGDAGGGGGDESGAALRSTKLGAALGRWIGAVRKISAANALKEIMEAKLKKANGGWRWRGECCSGGMVVVAMVSGRVSCGW